MVGRQTAGNNEIQFLERSPYPIKKRTIPAYDGCLMYLYGPFWTTFWPFSSSIVVRKYLPRTMIDQCRRNNPSNIIAVPSQNTTVAPRTSNRSTATQLTDGATANATTVAMVL